MTINEMQQWVDFYVESCGQQPDAILLTPDDLETYRRLLDDPFASYFNGIQIRVTREPQSVLTGEIKG